MSDSFHKLTQIEIEIEIEGGTSILGRYTKAKEKGLGLLLNEGFFTAPLSQRTNTIHDNIWLVGRGEGRRGGKGERAVIR